MDRNPAAWALQSSQAMASHVLTELAGQPIVPVATERLSRSFRNKVYQKLVTREKTTHGSVLSPLAL